MAVPYERIVAEDLNRGIGTVSVTMPAGGTATGTKLGLHSWMGWYNALDAGAAGDGSTDDHDALNTLANTTLSAGGSIFFPPGTYRIAQALTIPAGVTLRFARGAVLKPTTNITVTINGGLVAEPSQIFDLSASGAAVAFLSVGGMKTIDRCYPEWWGVVGNTGSFDTAAVQAAVNSGIPVCFARSYYVTTILIQTPTHPSTTILGNGYQLIGVASSGTAAILQFNGSFCTLRDLTLNGNFNTNYACGFQWLSTVTNGGPIYNTFDNIHVSNVLLAFVVGTPPSGTGSGTPIAGDLSESSFINCSATQVQNCLYCNQSNAKTTWISPRFIITDTGWGVAWSKDNTWIINNPPYDGTVGGGEIIILGGELYNNEYGNHGQGIIGASIVISGVEWEVGGTNTINGTSQQPRGNVIIRDLTDAGGPGGGTTYFVIGTNLSGIALILERCNFNQASGFAGGHSLVDASAGGSVNAVVIIEKCQLQEWVWDYTAPGLNGSAPLVKGCLAVIRDVNWYTLSPAVSGFVNSNEGRSIFDSADAGFGSLVETANQVTKNGWAYIGNVDAGNTFAGEHSDLPAFSGATQALMLTSGGVGTAAISSPTGASGFRVRTGGATDTLVLRGDVKTNNVGTAQIRIAFYRWDGSAASVPTITVLGGDLTVVNFTSWQRFAARVKVPLDAQFAAIELDGTGGAVIKVAELHL